MSYSNLDDIYVLFDLDGKILYEKSISGTVNNKKNIFIIFLSIFLSGQSS